MQRKPPIRSRRLRESARGQQCTYQIPGVCNHDPATTVPCHVPDDSGTGKMGGKSDDWLITFGCSDCHSVIDGRVPYNWQAGEKDWYMRRAMIRAWRHWIENGYIEIT